MMFSHNLVFLLGISFISKSVSQIINNDTLIYDWDIHHKINWFCQFATMPQIKNLSISLACYQRNKGMLHISADGSKTFPYLAHGSKIGFILKCGDIPRGKLSQSCNKYVHTNCNYTCDSSNVIHTLTCNLIGPWNNVTAQWSDKEPCAEAAISKCGDIQNGKLLPDCTKMVNTNCSYTCGSSDVIHTMTCNLDGPKNNATAQWSVKVPCDDLVVTPVPPSDDANIIIIVATIVLIVVGVFIVAGIWCFCRRNRQHQIFVVDLAVQNDSSNKEISSPLLQDSKMPNDLKDESQPNVDDLKNEVSLLLVDDLKNEESLPLVDNNSGTRVEAASREATAIAELQNPLDYNFNNTENMHKSKDTKDMVEALKFSTMRRESIDNIKVGLESETVHYCKSSKEEKVNVNECTTSVQLLTLQTNTYRKQLRPELEVISGRSREQALVGYVEENAQSLGYTRNEIKMIEESYKSWIDEKVSDRFLQKLAESGTTLGSLVQYFNKHGNKEAVMEILKVHKGCRFCDQFQR